MHDASSEKKTERAAVSGPVVAFRDAIRPCPVCGAAMTRRQTSACSDRCRAAKSRRKRGDDLALVEESLTRALSRVRVLRGTQAGA